MQRLLVYSDSALAIQQVTQGVSLHHLHGSLVRGIQDLLRRAWSVELRHTWREGNFVADALAKKVASQREALVLLAKPPAALLQLVVGGCLYSGVR